MILTLLVALAAQASSSPRAAVQLYQPRNVIVVVLDDVGTEQLAAYGGPTAWGESRARMPVLDQLRAHGVMFRRAWASPLCSPTRAMFLTGRHGFRTGVFGVAETPGPCSLGMTATGALSCCPVGDPDCSLPENPAALPLHPTGYSLPDSEITIAEMLRDSVFPGGATYARGAFGKWHLSALPSDPCHPIRQGFNVFVGHLSNNESAEGGHFAWQRHSARSTPSGCQVYSSVVTGQWDAERTGLDARGWIDSVLAENPRRSFFAMVSFNPPHWPFQVPPQSFVSPGTWDELVLAGLGTEGQRVEGVRSCQPGTNQEIDSRNARLVYRASLEAVDTLIGRLVFRSSTEPFPLENTTVIVVGDNGTPDHIAWCSQDPSAVSPNAAPFLSNHAKRQVFELGVRVPLIVTGAGVAEGATCDTLVSAVDLPATILDLVGATTAFTPQVMDGQSFAGRFVHPSAPFLPGDREHIYTEVASRNGMTYSSTARMWSPVLPGGPVEYQRAILDVSGFKYIRRVVGVDPGCSLAVSACDVSPEEEIYRLFDVNGELDLYESLPLCGDVEAELQRANLRLLMDALYSGG